MWLGMTRNELHTRTISSATMSTFTSLDTLPASCSRRSWPATNARTVASVRPPSPIVEGTSAFGSAAISPPISGFRRKARSELTKPSTTRSAAVSACSMSMRNWSK